MRRKKQVQVLSIVKINKYLSSIKKGREDGLTRLFKYTSSNLYRVASIYLINKNDADDVLSQAYENVVKYIHTFDKSMNGYNWLFTIVKNCAKEFNKQEYKRQKIVCDIDEEIKDEFDVLEHVILKDAIKILQVHEKRLLYQLYWEGLTVKEISQKSGIPITTIYSRIESIYKRLRDFYKK